MRLDPFTDLIFYRLVRADSDPFTDLIRRDPFTDLISKRFLIRPIYRLNRPSSDPFTDLFREPDPLTDLHTTPFTDLIRLHSN